MSKPLINGTRHSWSSLRANILGRTSTGITAVSYEDSTEKVNNYGSGNMPVSRGSGKYEAKAKVTLAAYEIEAIMTSAKASGYKRIQDIPAFDIPVVYLPTGQDGLVTHVIRNCEFTTNKREIKQGDTMIETEYELIISHIDW
jgi:hypothetical protein